VIKKKTPPRDDLAKDLESTADKGTFLDFSKSGKPSNISHLRTAMDDTSWTPSVFANKVILQFVHHILAEDMVVEPDDYMAIRIVFRKVGGSWDELANGSIVMLELLQKIIAAWGKMPERQHESDRLI
jgi:hypothetical protein